MKQGFSFCRYRTPTGIPVCHTTVSVPPLQAEGPLECCFEEIVPPLRLATFAHYSKFIIFSEKH